MPLYECVLIARQDVSSSQVEGLVGQFTEIIENNGGRIAMSEMWGLRNLAYKIKKNRKGHYALIHIDAPSAAVQEMERNMRLNEDVLRYLTVRVDELEEGPSVVMLSKQGRDERGGRGGGRGGFRGEGRGGFRDDRGRGGDRPAGPAKPEAEAKPKDEAKPEAEAKPEDKAKTEDKAKPEAEAKPEAKDAGKEEEVSA